MAATEPPSAGALDRAREGDGVARLVSALESLRPGTRLLTDGQQTVLTEYEHIVDQLRSPTFSPPPPEISDFRAEDGKVKIFGKHLRQPITVTIAGFRADFEFQEAGEGESPYIEADVPENAEAGSVVVLTSGGSCATVRPFRRAEMAPSVPPVDDEVAADHSAPLFGDEPAAEDSAPPEDDEPAAEGPARI